MTALLPVTFEDMADVLRTARDFIDRYSDVVDGDCGEPHPNEAMQLVGAIDEVLP